MLKDFLGKHITSQASFVEYGYGQVEPNHLSAQRTAQIYAQLPADSKIEVLEQGQFVKYDYENGLVNFTGDGEWMLVYNETKLYREEQVDCEFAMVKENYGARVYSPLDPDTLNWDARSRDYRDIALDNDYRDIYATNDPFHFEAVTKPKMMPEGTTMVPRVFKTNIGDHFTTNTVMLDKAAAKEDLMGKVLAPNEKGILAEAGEDADMKWKVVKVYTMPDGQRGVKVLRIA
jgi:hypothetical protein